MYTFVCHHHHHIKHITVTDRWDNFLKIVIVACHMMISSSLYRYYLWNQLSLKLLKTIILISPASAARYSWFFDSIMSYYTILYTYHFWLVRHSIFYSTIIQTIFFFSRNSHAYNFFFLFCIFSIIVKCLSNRWNEIA